MLLSWGFTQPSNSEVDLQVYQFYTSSEEPSWLLSQHVRFYRCYLKHISFHKELSHMENKANIHNLDSALILHWFWFCLFMLFLLLKKIFFKKMCFRKSLCFHVFSLAQIFNVDTIFNGLCCRRVQLSYINKKLNRNHT